MKIYKVGGCIRDKLLDLPVSDNDYVVVGSSPEEMESLGYVSVGKDFPVFLHPETKEEYALARTEMKTSQGYKGFSFRFGPDVTLEKDLKRRDITINAIAEDIDGKLIDPYGGITDISNRIIRHTSKAFAEDPLRVLRVARFVSRFDGFFIHSNTMDFLNEISDSELKALTPERVWMELEKTLKTKKPHLFFTTLQTLDILHVLFPELGDLVDVKEPPEHHPELYSWEHSLLSLVSASIISEDPTIRFAALIHDLGKGITPKEELPHHYGHDKKGIDIVKQLCDRLKIPNDYKDLALLSCRYHMRVRMIWKLKNKTIVKTLMALDAFRRPNRFYKFLQVCEADFKGRLGKENEECREVKFLYNCFCVCFVIGYKDVENKNLKGKQIADEIYRLRIREVAKLRRELFS
jgi:tRNA nucleotidyltransferase (CCA-adding enzyme)